MTKLQELEKRLAEKKARFEEEQKKILAQKRIIEGKENAKARKERARVLIQIGAIVSGDKHAEVLAMLKDSKEKAEKVHTAMMNMLATLPPAADQKI